MQFLPKKKLNWINFIQISVKLENIPDYSDFNLVFLKNMSVETAPA